MSRPSVPRIPIVLAVIAGAVLVSACNRNTTPQPAAATPAGVPDGSPMPSPVATPNPSPIPSPVPSPPEATPLPTPAATADAGATPPDASAAPAEAKPVDSLKWMQDAQARTDDYYRRISDAEDALQKTQPAIALWEKNILAFRNPFVRPPQLTPEEQQEITGMDAIKRVAWAQQKLDAANAAHDAAQKTLNDLKSNPPKDLLR